MRSIVDGILKRGELVLGRGIGDKNTKESLALACFDDACTQARFVYFQASNPLAYWVGAPVSIDLQKKKQSRRAIAAMIKGKTGSRARGTAITYVAMGGILFGMRGMIILMGGVTSIGIMARMPEATKDRMSGFQKTPL